MSDAPANSQVHQAEIQQLAHDAERFIHAQGQWNEQAGSGWDNAGQGADDSSWDGGGQDDGGDDSFGDGDSGFGSDDN